MVFLKIYSARISIVIFLLLISFLSLYMLKTLQDEEDAVESCSWCRTGGFDSVGKDLNVDDDFDEVLDMFELPMYVKQLEAVDDGELAMYHDQFVLKGLTEQSAIRKSVNNIFVVESSCLVDLGSEEKLSEVFGLNAQEACGVESTARANPDRPVYILHSCPLADDFALRVPDYARALLDLHNVFVVVLDIAELSKGWPDPLPLSSTSLGLLALWQFGGTYCHLDTLFLRPLRALGTNYCGFREGGLLLSDLLLNFEPLGYGHTVVTQLLDTFSRNEDSGLWAGDDAYLTRVVIDQCSQLPKSDEDCNQLTIYDSTVLFTVGFTDEYFLNEDLIEEFVNRIKSTAYTINSFSHLNYWSEDHIPNQTFLSLTKEFCPNVNRRCNQTF